MIVTLGDNFIFDDYVKPIEIVNPTESELPDGTQCITSGFGYTKLSANGRPGTIATVLQWTDLECITRATCKQSWTTDTIESRQQW